MEMAAMAEMLCLIGGYFDFGYFPPFTVSDARSQTRSAVPVLG